MKKSLTIREYIFLVSMLFGMFFGAGNLIFPTFLGNQAGNHLVPSIIGFCITGVGIPLLGIVAMGLSKCNGLFDMSSKAGKLFGYFFSITLYLTIGPLFAIPRAATVSFTVGVEPFIGEGTAKPALAIFSVIFFAIVLFFSLKPHGILTWIGKILNPTFLVVLGILIAAVLFSPMGKVSEVSALGNYENMSFVQGILDGYNTLDVLAALAFGIILINAVRDLGLQDAKKISASAMKAGLFAVLGMAVIYAALALAGAGLRTTSEPVPNGGSALNLISAHYFGKFGAFLLGMIMTFACLKTAIGLVTACSTTFTEIFPKGPSYRTLAIVFSVFPLAISNVGLSNIISYSIPVLLFLYPLAMVLIALCLVDAFYKLNGFTFRLTIFVTTLAAFVEFLKALPENFGTSFPFYDGILKFYNALPLSEYGMGWIPLAFLALVIGGLTSLKAKKS